MDLSPNIFGDAYQARLLRFGGLQEGCPVELGHVRVAGDVSARDLGRLDVYRTTAFRDCGGARARGRPFPSPSGRCAGYGRSRGDLNGRELDVLAGAKGASRVHR